MGRAQGERDGAGMGGDGHRQAGEPEGGARPAGVGAGRSFEGGDGGHGVAVAAAGTDSSPTSAILR